MAYLIATLIKVSAEERRRKIFYFLCNGNGLAAFKKHFLSPTYLQRESRWRDILLKKSLKIPSRKTSTVCIGELTKGGIR